MEPSLICFDWDETSVKDHWHNLLTQENIPPLGSSIDRSGRMIPTPNGVQIKNKQGFFRVGSEENPRNPSGGVNVEKMEEFIQEHPVNDQMIQAMFNAALKGHKVAITSYTHYPDAIEIAINLKLENEINSGRLTQEQANQIQQNMCIIGGFPSSGQSGKLTTEEGSLVSVGKIEHIQAAKRHFGMENMNNNKIIYIDDNRESCQSAREILKCETENIIEMPTVKNGLIQRPEDEENRKNKTFEKILAKVNHLPTLQRESFDARESEQNEIMPSSSEELLEDLERELSKPEESNQEEVDLAAAALEVSSPKDSTIPQFLQNSIAAQFEIATAQGLNITGINEALSNLLRISKPIAMNKKKEPEPALNKWKMEDNTLKLEIPKKEGSHITATMEKIANGVKCLAPKEAVKDPNVLLQIARTTMLTANEHTVFRIPSTLTEDKKQKIASALEKAIHEKFPNPPRPKIETEPEVSLTEKSRHKHK